MEIKSSLVEFASFHSVNSPIVTNLVELLTVQQTGGKIPNYLTVCSLEPVGVSSSPLSPCRNKTKQL
jgi:hypothetical protein